MVDEIDLPYPQYRCPTCGKDLPLNEARMTVTCAEHQPADSLEFTVRAAHPTTGTTSRRSATARSARPRSTSSTGPSMCFAGENLIAEADGALAGLLSTAVHGGELVIVLLSVYPGTPGPGSRRRPAARRGRACARARAAFGASRGVKRRHPSALLLSASRFRPVRHRTRPAGRPRRSRCCRLLRHPVPRRGAAPPPRVCCLAPRRILQGGSIR
jgi:hypothetical protein